jgi:hypothetical protein
MGVLKRMVCNRLGALPIRLMVKLFIAFLPLAGILLTEVMVKATFRNFLLRMGETTSTRRNTK